MAGTIDDMRRILRDIGDCLNRVDLEWKPDSLQVLWGEHWKEEEKVALHVTQKGGGKASLRGGQRIAGPRGNH